MKRTRLPEVTPGAEVFTADEQSLGVVVEVGEVSFKVDVPRGSDIWLGRDYVVDSAPERLSMSFDRSELGGYKLGQPGLSAEKDTTQESIKDTVVPPEQQAEQRLRMEKELAEQRRQLPHEHPDGREYLPPDTGGTLGQPVEEELRRAGIDPMRDSAPNNRGHDVEEFSDTEPFVDAPSSTQAYGNTVDYGAAPMYGEARRSKTTAGLAIVMAGAAGATFFLLMRRRRNRKFDARARDAARQAASAAKDAAQQAAQQMAEAAKVAGRRGMDGARDAIDTARG